MHCLLQSNKKTLPTPLRQNNCFIRINKWGSVLDIVNIGWIYRANPKVHNQNQIKANIVSACNRLNIKFVDFELFTKGLSFHHPNSDDQKRIKTFAIQFACPKPDATVVTSILKSCFNDNDNDTSLPGLFIQTSISSTIGLFASTVSILLPSKLPFPSMITQHFST